MEPSTPQEDTGISLPRNVLELAMESAQTGRSTQADFVGALIRSDVFVLSQTEVQPDGSGLRPLLHRTDDDVIRVAVFTDPERADNAARLSSAPFLLQINGLEFLKRVPPELGIMLNPDSESTLQAEISAEGVLRIVQEAGAGIL